MLSDHFWTPSRSQGRRCPFLGKLRQFPCSRRRVEQPSINPLSSAHPPFLSATSSPVCPSPPVSSALGPGAVRGDRDLPKYLHQSRSSLQGCSCRTPHNLTSSKPLGPWVGLPPPPHLSHPRYWLRLRELCLVAPSAITGSPRTHGTVGCCIG